MTKSSLNILLFLFIFLFLGFVDLSLGLSDFNFSVLKEALFNYDDTDTTHVILIKLRVPKIIFIALSGAAICLSGYLLQVLVQNPLADAYILGGASGASVGANLAILGWLPVYLHNTFILPLWATIGTLSTILIVTLIAHRKSGINTFILILGGVAVSSFIVAGNSLLIYFSESNEKIRNILFWAMGSFEHVAWRDIPGLSIIVLISILIFQYLEKPLHIMLLGEQKAKDLGVPFERLKWLILVFTSLLTAFCVSVCGPISFIGLIVPHFIRAKFGSIGRLNLIFVAILGSGVLLSCDIISRLIYPPVGLPIGIITSIIGIPFFIYLLVKSNYRY